MQKLMTIAGAALTALMSQAALAEFGQDRAAGGIA